MVALYEYRLCRLRRRDDNNDVDFVYEVDFVDYVQIFVFSVFLYFSDAAATEVPSLKKMKNKDILLTLPGTLKVRDINWLSVWCMRFTVNYGEVYIPKDVKIPEKVTLSSFSADTMGKLSSGPITILDATSFYIRNLRLYLEEPGYHFWVGNSSFMTPNRDGFMVRFWRASSN